MKEKKKWRETKGARRGGIAGEEDSRRKSSAVLSKGCFPPRQAFRVSQAGTNSIPWPFPPICRVVAAIARENYEDPYFTSHCAVSTTPGIVCSSMKAK